MNVKYSVFISNVASCCDRYCAAYGRPFSIEEMFERAASIPSLEAVDIVLTEEFKSNIDTVFFLACKASISPIDIPSNSERIRLKGM